MLCTRIILLYNIGLFNRWTNKREWKKKTKRKKYACVWGVKIVERVWPCRQGDRFMVFYLHFLVKNTNRILLLRIPWYIAVCILWRGGDRRRSTRARSRLMGLYVVVVVVVLFISATRVWRTSADHLTFIFPVIIF